MSGQVHSLGISSGYHYNEQSLYLSKAAQEFGTEVSSGLFKFSLGAEYSYIFKKNASWLLSLRGEYAYRSFITTNYQNGAPSYGSKFNAEYIDLLIGIGKRQRLGRSNCWGINLYPGVGVSILKDNTEPGAPIRPEGINIYRHLPFVELDVFFRLLHARKSQKSWYAEISPFVRTYLSPMYEMSPSKTSRLFLGYGVSLQIGIEWQ